MAEIIYNKPFLGLIEAADGLNFIFSSPIDCSYLVYINL